MAKARKNLLAGRLAEHLVCAELARQGFIATTFSHNVPVYDILATDGECRTVPIQVKATRDKYWRSTATNWMEIVANEEHQTQVINGPIQLNKLNPVWVCVAIGPSHKEDQFFVMTQYDLQKILINNYSKELRDYAGKRPKNWQAVDCWWGIHDITEFKDKWHKIVDRLAGVDQL